MQDTQIFSVKISDHNRGSVVHNYLSLATTPLQTLQEQKSEFLHQIELAHFANLQYTLRQTSYMRGRYAAKLALAQLRADIHSTSIAVCNNIFGAPYLHSERGLDAAISISHTNACAAALAFAQSYPMAIDLEQISAQRLEAIQSEMLPVEIELVNNNLSDKNLGLTLAWTAKEALSKVLGCGLCIDFKYLQLSEVNKVANGYSCMFKNFTQYQAYAWLFDLNVLAIVFPAKCEIELIKKL